MATDQTPGAYTVVIVSNLRLTTVIRILLSTPETLGSWTDDRISCRHSSQDGQEGLRQRHLYRRGNSCCPHCEVGAGINVQIVTGAEVISEHFQPKLGSVTRGWKPTAIFSEGEKNY